MIKKREWLLIAITIIFVASVFFATQQSIWRSWIPRTPVPDFSSYKDVKQKKLAFFSYLKPMVDKSNRRVLSERSRILTLQKKNNLSPWELTELQSIALRYRIVSFDQGSEGFKTLLQRVDSLPPSLVLAQGANESSWGTSRFARDGKNFFGLWCYTTDCGLVPEKRESGRRHKVAEFDTVQEGVDYYFYTLNSHPAYNDLRELRVKLSNTNQPLTGHALAQGLLFYSERREAYVQDIRTMIRINDLLRYDTEVSESK
jgi:Bax protein